MIQQVDGDYSFILLKEGMMVAGRDPIGVQPLYYGENKEIAAFATNRRALWQLGIKTPLSFPPGNLGFADKQGFKFKPVKTLTYSLSQPLSIDEAALKLQVFLEESIKRRVRGLEKVAIAFSGGLDSSLISFMANKLGVKVTLIHVSMENKPETEEAIAAADALNLPLQVDLFKESDVEKTVPKVVKLIEEPNSVKTSIGVPFYWISEKASEEGFKVILAGQGADELFGGYQRYVNEYCQNGNEKAQKTMFNDVFNIYESNLERDKKISSHFDIDLRLPFAMFELVDFAMRLPLDCKMEQKPNTLRKLVLRKLALNLGLPKSIADKPKKAVQYSTGINDAIKRIAKKHKKTVNSYILELFQQDENNL
jgi:asparagine synthase (glutamine-hydrolysing)